MTVEELKQSFPVESVVELDPEKRYVITVPRDLSMQMCEMLHAYLEKRDIKSAIIQGEGIKFYGLSE